MYCINYHLLLILFHNKLCQANVVLVIYESTEPDLLSLLQNNMPSVTVKKLPMNHDNDEDDTPLCNALAQVRKSPNL